MKNNITNIDNLNYEELENIYKNKELLNYKQLCQKLNIPVLTSNSKKKQLRELSAVFKHERRGQKYLITEICDKEVVDLFNNRSIYLPYIQILLSHIFEEKNAEELFFSTKEIMCATGMINNNFKTLTGKYMKLDCNTISNIHGYNKDNFYKYIDKGYNSVLKPIIRSALSSMQNSKSIEVITAYKAYSYKNRRYVYTSVEDDLGKEIFNIEGNTMTEMGIKGANELYGRKINLKDEYHERCNKKLKDKYEEQLFRDNRWEFDGFYRCYKIIINKKRLANNINFLKKEFNDLIKNKMLKTKTLNFLTGEELHTYIKQTISTDNVGVYDFKEEIKIIDDILKKEKEEERNLNC